MNNVDKDKDKDKGKEKDVGTFDPEQFTKFIDAVRDVVKQTQAYPSLGGWHPNHFHGMSFDADS